MFAKAIIIAFLSLSLTASAAPAASDCSVTVTARGVASSSALFSAGGGKGAAGGNGFAGGKGNAGAASSAVSASAAASSSSAAAASSGGNSDLQTSLTLDSSLIQTGFDQNGQSAADGQPEGAGQVAANTSANNFINFCATSNLPLTNGTQIKTGSCNAAPMGLIAATTAMPSAKFVSPKNLDTIPANQNFTIQMAIQNLETGNFVNPDTNYFAAPQTLNAQGLVVGHSHVVIEAIDSLTSTTPTDPTTFQFFKGLNDAAVGGILSTTVAGGLPAGTYRMASINAAANHQPVLVAVAQHGSLDDMVYFTVSDSANATSSSAASSAAESATAAASSGAASAASASAATDSAAASASAAAASGAAGAAKGGAGAGAAAAGAAKGGAGANAGKGGFGGAKGFAGAGKGKRWLSRM